MWLGTNFRHQSARNFTHEYICWTGFSHMHMHTQKKQKMSYFHSVNVLIIVLTPVHNIYVDYHMLCWQGLQFTDCVLCRGVRLHLKWRVFSLTLNCFWWWGPISEDLKNVETPLLPLLPGPFRHCVVVPVRDPSMGQIDLFKNCSFSVCQKKKTSRKNYKNNVNMNGIP